MNLSNLKPAEGSTKTRKKNWPWCRFWFGWYSQEVIKELNQDQVILRKSVLKVVRCLFNVGFEVWFKNINRVEYKAINLETIQKLAEAKN